MIPKRYYRFANIALELAEKAQGEMTYSLCALVVRKNKVISVGYNSRKTSPKMNNRMQMWHAEASALTRCPEGDLTGADLIVARIRRSGLPGLAKPCACCMGFIRHFGIRRVFYTCNDSNNFLRQL